MPHPLQHRIVVKIQTNRESNPKRAMELALQNLTKNLTDLETQFEVLQLEYFEFYVFYVLFLIFWSFE
jgi:DNA-directed RNA polymerase subunit L